MLEKMLTTGSMEDVGPRRTNTTHEPIRLMCRAVPPLNKNWSVVLHDPKRVWDIWMRIVGIHANLSSHQNWGGKWMSSRPH